MRNKIAFIGVGNMADAIISGITSKEENPTQWNNIILYNRHRQKAEKYAEHGAVIVDSLTEAVECADCVILSIKPQNFPEVLPLLSSCKSVKEKLFITIAAGIKTKTVSKAACGAPVVRVLPNTPMLIGKGVSAICRTDNVSDDDYMFACNIFSSAGSILQISEDEMNRIICVTSSSPAYIFTVIDAMYRGAYLQGLIPEGDDAKSKEILDSICDTIIGSAMLMKMQNKTPGEQICAVASKGGTTERALAELNENHISDIIVSAMQKCTDRADELSKS